MRVEQSGPEVGIDCAQGESHQLTQACHPDCNHGKGGNLPVNQSDGAGQLGHLVPSIIEELFKGPTSGVSRGISTTTSLEVLLRYW
jgi:hypothetical protein